MLTTRDELVTKSGQGDLRNSLRSAIYGLWLGEFSLWNFVDIVVMTIDRSYTRAWYESMAECGLTPSEMTDDERERLNTEVANDIQYAVTFGNDIMNNSKRAKGKLGPLMQRAEMWFSRYTYVRDLARTYACGDQKLRWVWNPRKEHCSDCARLNGRVYRASVWRKYDLSPRSRDLECRGFHCGCQFIQTNEPVTPGRPPDIYGRI